MTKPLTTAAALALILGAGGVYAAAQTSMLQTSRQQQVQQRIQQQIDKRFSKLDKNQDGVISRDEWKGRAKMFDRLDANHDGMVSKDEVQQAVQQRVTGLDERVEKRVDARFAKVDKNQDGVISRDEWPGSGKRFERLDANHDGMLSKDELRPALNRLVLRRLAIRGLLKRG